MLRSRHIGAIESRRRWITRASPMLPAFLLVLMCSVQCTMHDDRRDAALVLEHHFDALAHQKYDAALADYDPRFFEDVTPSEWRNALASVIAKVGTVKQYKLTVDGLESKKTVGPGTYLKFKCKVTYAKHSSEEIFYLYRRDGATQFRIVGHQIDAAGLIGD